jgi:2-aminobenzoylacetyl-CoA thioesterase
MPTEYNDRQPFPVSLAERLYVLGNPFFNQYLIRGDKASALIEMGISATTDEAVRQLSVIDAKPDYLIVAHPHVDHINGLNNLRKAFPEAIVIAGKGAPEFVAHPRVAVSLVEEDRFMTEFMAAEGIRSAHSPLETAPSLSGCRIALDGDTLDLGGITLQFISVGGHSPGNIVVFIPELKALIASDSLGFRYSSGLLFPIYFTGFQEYINTIARLASFNPAILGLAHHGTVAGKDIPSVFNEARRTAIEMKESIVNNTGSDEQIIAGIFEKFYKDDLMIYAKDNIIECCRLLIKRSRE